MGKDDMTLLIVGLVAIGGVGAFYLMKKRGEEDVEEALQPQAAPKAPMSTALMTPEEAEVVGPFGDCTKKQKCNCAACCAKMDCHKHKKSRRCPCDQVRLGLQQRMAKSLEAEEDIYSYYSSIDQEPGIIIA